MGARANIPDHMVAEIVRDYWQLVDMLARHNDTHVPQSFAYDVYPPSPCDVLEAMGYPYKLARAKLTRMLEKGQLEWLLTPCVPAREIHWEKIEMRPDDKILLDFDFEALEIRAALGITPPETTSDLVLEAIHRSKLIELGPKEDENDSQ